MAHRDVELMKSQLCFSMVVALLLVGCKESTKTGGEQTGGGSSSNAPSAPASAANTPQSDMTTTASGLKYQVLKKGTGTVSPKATDTVNVHYHGTLLNGTVFDSSVERGQPISFPLNQVIRGWTHPRMDRGTATDEGGRQVQIRNSTGAGLRPGQSEPEDSAEQHAGVRSRVAGDSVGGGEVDQ
jgi:hypothetical protein